VLADADRRLSLATTAGGNQTLFVSDMERGPGF
jgi:hypothetical protein